jgi:arsenate reductase
MTQITLYHNPRCSKSRQALALLQELGIAPAVRLYLQDPLNEKELHHLLKQLDIAPRALMRDSDPLYRELNLANADLSDEVLVQQLAANPSLLQRPIAVSDSQAIVARPPELVLELLA